MELISWTTAIAFLVALPIYWWLPAAKRGPFLCVYGLVYFLASQPQAGLIALIFLWVILYFQRLILTAQTDRGKKWVLFFGVAIALAPMIFYKYRFSLLGHIPFLAWMAALPLAAPVGISYFTFRAVHVLVETRRGAIERLSGIDFFYYITFLPTVVAGPIERFGPFREQRAAAHEFSPDLFGEGLQRILIGLVKKLVLADMFYGFISDFMNPVTTLTLRPWQIWLCLHGYYAYLYMDFSGYSDIAIGVSRLFGFRIMENFNWPILATNIREFWRRWHISLTSWLTDYVYFALGGNKKGKVRAEINTMITMLLIALWHGSNQIGHYIIWGIWLGLGLVVFRQWTRVKARLFPNLVENPTLVGQLVGAFMTIQFMNLSWPIFLFESRVAILTYLKMFGLVGR